MSTRRAIAMLILAMALFALGTPLTKWLALNGETLGLHGENAISFCNILFVGNLCAGLAVLAYFRVWPVLSDLAALSPSGWMLVITAASLSVVVPAMLFFALKTTSVANVVLLGRFGPLLFSIVGAIAVSRPIGKLEWIGNSFIFVSIALVAFVTGGGMINRGDWLVLAAGVVYCVTALVSQSALAAAGLRAFVFARNFVAAVIFFAIALWLFGWYHFAEAFMARLWLVMTIYALVAVVAAQLAWYYALQRVEPTAVGTWSIISPAMGIVFALLLLHERPQPAQWIALGLTSIGIAIANAEALRTVWLSNSTESSLSAVT